MGSNKESNQQPNGTYRKIATGLGWFSIGLGAAELLAPGSVSQLIGIAPRSSNNNVLRFYGARELAAGIGILAQPGDSAWLWSRVAGDALDLSTMGAAFASSRTDKTKLALATVAVAGVTALDVLCATQLREHDRSSQIKQMSGDSWSTVNVRKSMIISRSPEEVYGFYRNLRNHSRLSPHLESVEVLDEKRSRWHAKTPGGKSVGWTAEITQERPNAYLAWTAVPPSDIEASGTVRFDRAPGNRGTIIRAEMNYKPSLGAIGAAAAKFVKELAPGKQVEDSLRRLRQILETGDIVKSDASIHVGMHPGQPSTGAQAATA